MAAYHQGSGYQGGVTRYPGLDQEVVLGVPQGRAFPRQLTLRGAATSYGSVTWADMGRHGQTFGPWLDGRDFCLRDLPRVC